MMNGTGMMSMMVFMFLIGLLIVALFVVIGVAVVKWLSGTKMPFVKGNQENALEILRNRYARGEISRDEFNAIKTRSLRPDNKRHGHSRRSLFRNISESTDHPAQTKINPAAKSGARAASLPAARSKA